MLVRSTGELRSASENSYVILVVGLSGSFPSVGTNGTIPYRIGAGIPFGAGQRRKLGLFCER